MRAVAPSTASMAWLSLSLSVTVPVNQKLGHTHFNTNSIGRTVAHRANVLRSGDLIVGSGETKRVGPRGLLSVTRVPTRRTHASPLWPVVALHLCYHDNSSVERRRFLAASQGSGGPAAGPRGRRSGPRRPAPASGSSVTAPAA